PPRPRHSNSRGSWAAARAGALAAASRPTAPPPPPPAAASRDSPLAPAAPRASPARGPVLLRPSGGPEESPEPARPSPAACVIGRSYALLVPPPSFPLSSMESGVGGEDCGHGVGAVHRRLDFADASCAMDKAGHRIRARGKRQLPSNEDDKTRLEEFAREKQNGGAPSDVLSIRVEISAHR